MPSITAIITVQYTPKALPWPSTLKLSVNPVMGRPLVLTSTNPLITYWRPSVMINGGSASFTTMPAFNRPHKAPTSRVIRIATGIGRFSFAMANPQTMPPKLVTALTERSEPPEINRQVSGAAMMKE